MLLSIFGHLCFSCIRREMEQVSKSSRCCDFGKSKTVSLIWSTLIDVQEASSAKLKKTTSESKRFPLPAIPEGCAKWFNLNLLCAYVYINIVLYVYLSMREAHGSRCLTWVPLLAYLNFVPEPLWYVTVKVHVTICTRVKVHGATPTREFSGRPL